MHTFTFFYADSGGQMTVDLASWEILHLEPALEELRVHAPRHTFDIVIGSGLLGRFVYLPEHNAGFQIYDLSQVDHFNDCLTGILECDDAAAVSSALQDYVSY